MNRDLARNNEPQIFMQIKEGKKKGYVPILDRCWQKVISFAYMSVYKVHDVLF